jgi:hypothetical protein
MITYKDIYDAAKRNPLVSFELPQNIERWHPLFASGRYHETASGGLNDNI